MEPSKVLLDSWYLWMCSLLFSEVVCLSQSPLVSVEGLLLQWEGLQWALDQIFEQTCNLKACTYVLLNWVGQIFFGSTLFHHVNGFFFSDRDSEMNLSEDRYSVLTLLSIKSKRRKYFFSILKTTVDLSFISNEWMSRVVFTTMIYKCNFLYFLRVIIYITFCECF